MTSDWLTNQDRREFLFFTIGLVAGMVMMWVVGVRP
jgi:hypothetical protein